MNAASVSCPLISIHAPGWGATIPGRKEGVINLFQSTHPGGVRLLRLYSQGISQGISIHAPGWGATYTSVVMMVVTTISIHAPGWGATLYFFIGGSFLSDFNPRTRVGCDSAPAIRLLQFPSFQSTHPGGVRPYSSDSFSSADFVFQSTHPGGVRPAVLVGRLDERFVISIHAPGWGATARRPIGRITRQFQSTHPGGVRRSL